MSTTSEERLTGWGLPLVALGAGTVALPMLFLTPMSFVFALLLILVAACSALVVLLDRRPAPQTAVASFGGLVAAVAFLLTVLPFLGQQE